MTEKTAEIDQKKSETLEEISAMVEKINKEFKEKQKDLQPLISKLKVNKYFSHFIYLIKFNYFIFRLFAKIIMKLNLYIMRKN